MEKENASPLILSLRNCGGGLSLRSSFRYPFILALIVGYRVAFPPIARQMSWIGLGSRCFGTHGPCLILTCVSRRSRAFLGTYTLGIATHHLPYVVRFRLASERVDVIVDEGYETVARTETKSKCEKALDNAHLLFLKRPA